MSLAWLKTLDDDALGRLLDRRRDAVRGVPPRNLSELADRLALPHSVSAALQQLPLPALQVAEAAQALGGETVGRLELAQFLDGGGSGRLDAVLAELTDLGVLVPAGEGQLAVPAAFDDLFPDPLRLGEPLRVLLREVSVDGMRKLVRVLGLPKVQQNRAATAAVLVEHFRDREQLAATVAAAPDVVVTTLLRTVARDHDDYRYDYDREQAAAQWARSAGLAIEAGYRSLRLPAEVARALRGPDYRAPFTPEPPALQVLPVSAERVSTESAAAASAFAANALAVLDRIAQAGVATIAAGGVGSRELAKLSKATGVAELDTRLILELAVRAELLAPGGRQLGPTSRFRSFRDAEPAERFATLLQTWAEFPGTPTEARDDLGKAMPAGAPRAACGGCQAARGAVLDLMASIDGAVEPEPAVRAALWRRPLVHAVGDPPLAAVWREAELMGVLALGALSPLGRALGDGDAMRAVAARLLPPSIDEVVFGADLTAYVAGAPSSRVSRLLDAAADRESGGGAVTWRFGPASVRRALDDGLTELAADLAGVARGSLPSALTVLIADVARKHGNLRLTAAVCCLRSDDVALLAEVVRDRRLAKLGLRTLTPTVLVGDLPPADTLAALRKAGYFPLSDDPAAVPRATATVRRPLVAAAERPVDVAEVVRQLRRVPADAPAATSSLTERLLVEAKTRLSLGELRQLAHAIDEGQPVNIGYEAASGVVTDRVVSDLELAGPVLVGWCELRQDGRSFTIRRILSVQPV